MTATSPFGHCRHYIPQTGGRVECGKGVDVRRLVGGKDFGWALRMPCTKKLDQTDVVACELRDMPTAEEAAEAMAQLMRDADTLLAGTCPQCGADMVQSEDPTNINSHCPNCVDVFSIGCKRIDETGGL